MFWMCVALNAWSSAISFILRSYELPALVTRVVAGFAIANVVLGLPIALRLIQERVDTGRVKGVPYSLLRPPLCKTYADQMSRGQ